MFDALASRITHFANGPVRTTLDIDDDVLLAAKEIARRDKKSLGQVLRDLARQSFTRPTHSPVTPLGTGLDAVSAAPTASERIALHDRDHVHHELAAGWLADRAETGWASCPLTQNGCLRIMSQPGYGQPQPPPVLVSMLRQFALARWHAFWPDDLSVLDHRLGSRDTGNPAAAADSIQKSVPSPA
jgi:hypothetical protein